MARREIFKFSAKRVEPTPFGDLRELLINILASPDELNRRYEWFASFGYGTEMPTFKEWMQDNVNDLPALNYGHTGYNQVLNALRDFQKIPIADQDSFATMRAHLNRAWNIYVKVTRVTDQLVIERIPIFEPHTARQVLKMIQKFPTDLTEGVEVFWHIPHGMTYLMYILRQLLSSLVFVFDRIYKHKLVEFDLPMCRYRMYNKGYAYFGDRPYDEYDSDQGDLEHEPDEDTPEWDEWYRRKTYQWKTFEETFLPKEHQ